VEKLKKELNAASAKELLKALHVDVYDTRGIDLHTGTVPLYTGPESEFFPANWGGGIFSFWNMREYENRTSAGWTLDIGPPPLSGTDNIHEMEKYPWPDVEWFSFNGFREKLAEWSDFSIMATGASVFQHATFIRGMDTLMMDMMTAPEQARFILGKVTDFYYEYYNRMFEAAGELIDVFALADDLGTQDSLLIGPELYDEYIAPGIRKMADLAHRNGIRLLLHSCGNVEMLIPRFINSGVDILDPIQPESMDPLAIKAEYGRKICLRGGVSVQNVVSRGSINEVVAETQRIVTALKQGGGYIFSPGHPVLQDDIPAGNIIAMYETAYLTGFY
jgi:uroporphyrinogen decarboxylase